MQLDAPFPLTPALSLRERESISQSKARSPSSEFLESAKEGSLSLGRGLG